MTPDRRYGSLFSPLFSQRGTADPAADPDRNNFTPVRLLLAVLVMVYHFRVLTGETRPLWPMMYPDFAVNGFYVISGFLVFESFDRKPELRSFFIRRFCRLYPLYIVVIAAMTAMLLALQPDGALNHLREAVRYFLVNAVFLNFLQDTIGTILVHLPDHGFNPSLWTLKVEVGFYLLVPLIWHGVRRFGTGWIVAGVFAALLYTTLMRLGNHWTLGKQLPGAMAYFFIGILMFIYRRAIHVRTPVAVLAALVGFVGVLLIQTGLWDFDAQGWAILFPFLVAPQIYLLTLRLPPLKLHRDVSYGVYLIHGPVIQTLVVLSVIHFSVGSLALVAAIVFALAFASERWIERRFVRLGHAITRHAPPSSTPLAGGLTR